MGFYPTDTSKYRPTKLLLSVDLLREMDRIIHEGLGGYTNRHELVNDLMEQGLIDLRYGDETQSPPSSAIESPTSQGVANSGGPGSPGTLPTDAPGDTMSGSAAAGPISTRIEAPSERGITAVNELGRAVDEPLFGMHNRDAPSAWALLRLAHFARHAPVPMGSFYGEVAKEAWELASLLERQQTTNGQKLAVMLPRNRNKPQSATEGFQAFALGHVSRKPDEEGRLAAWGPFYQWQAVAVLGDVKDPHIALTEAGWELLQALDGLDFSIPHDVAIAQRFLGYLRSHARGDFWGFLTAIEGASRGLGRIEMVHHFQRGLNRDFPETAWKESVAASVTQGYVSRARAWGLIEPKMREGAYRLTADGGRMLEDSPAKSVS